MLLSSNVNSVREAVNHLNHVKLSDSGKSSSQRKLDAMHEITQATNQGYLPSGPRAKGVGCDDEVIPVKWTIFTHQKPALNPQEQLWQEIKNCSTVYHLVNTSDIHLGQHCMAYHVINQA